MEKRICCVLNYGPHYREAILKKMDRELKCDFYFGDNVFFELKKMDFSTLQGYKGQLKTSRFRSFTWHIGIRKVLFGKYDYFIITADPRCLSYWLLVFICRFRNKKIFMWGHGVKLPYPTRKTEFLTKTFFKNASGGFLLYGNYAKDVMIREGFSEKKLHVFYNSLDYERQIKLRETQKSEAIYTGHFRNSDPVVIFIGRLQREKKLEMIIEAQARLIQNGININVVFIGGGEMDELLKSMREKYGLTNRIWFFGPCYDEEQIARLIYNATLTVSPGDIGLTAIHSLTYGTPVITHSSYSKHGPEYEAITQGETGDFFEESNIGDLADKIGKWTCLLKVDRQKTRIACYSKIDLHYNPKFQIRLLKSILK